MQVIGDIFNTVLFGPILNLLVAILQGLEFIHLPGALGFAIIILTIVIRLLVWPFMQTKLKSARKMAELKPQLDDLKIKHKGDKQGLASAQMALYKQHGVNPAGGCIPALIQLPVFIALANAIPMLFDANQLQKVNDLLYFPNLKLIAPPDPHFAGFSLGDKLIDKTPFVGEWWVLMLIPIITMALSFIQSKMMLPVKPLQVRTEDSKVAIKEKEGVEDTMGAMQSQMMFMMPLMIGVFSYQFPVGLSLYWNIFTLVGIIQQYLIAGWGGFAPWIKIIRR